MQGTPLMRSKMLHGVLSVLTMVLSSCGDSANEVGQPPEAAQVRETRPAMADQTIEIRSPPSEVLSEVESLLTDGAVGRALDDLLGPTNWSLGRKDGSGQVELRIHESRPDEAVALASHLVADSSLSIYLPGIADELQEKDAPAVVVEVVSQVNSNRIVNENTGGQG